MQLMFENSSFTHKTNSNIYTTRLGIKSSQFKIGKTIVFVPKLYMSFVFRL